LERAFDQAAHKEWHKEITTHLHSYTHTQCILFIHVYLFDFKYSVSTRQCIGVLIGWIKALLNSSEIQSSE